MGFTDDPGAQEITTKSRKKGKYLTAKHHIISGNFFNGKKGRGYVKPKIVALKYDLTLTNWNVNDTPNVICLPRFQENCYQHNLQSHRGSHPASYNKEVAELLRHVGHKKFGDKMLAFRTELKLIKEYYPTNVSN